MSSSSSSSNNLLYSQAVSFRGIQGLYPSFHTAAVLLRMAKPEVLQLCSDASSNKESLEDYYRLIDEVERDLLSRQSHLTTNAPFIVLVEGLDGSGKSTLVKSLSKHLTNASAWCTPSQSITPEVREAFDRMGGAIARAFYMASNYILAFEILQHHLSTGNENHVYVVDRWYASTCAYSIAWKNTFGTSSSPQEYIRLLDNVVFQWPHDLMAPQLLLLLDVDHEIRKERVQTRNISNNHNPWDERLNQDEHLGRRIMSCMKRVNGPLEQVILNANQTQQEVLKEALDIVMNRVKQQQQQHMTTTACHRANDSLLSFFRANLTKKPVTLVLTGTHTAGKATLGKRVANIMGWSFDEELGDILRNEQLVAGGHRVGNGSGDDCSVSWDDFIFTEEIKRDATQQQWSRVVETWHVGNVGWALLRLENTSHSSRSSLKDLQEIVGKARKAIQNYQKVATILIVHLRVTLETCLTRRKVAANSERVPMKDEQTECRELHRALDDGVVELLQNEFSDLNLPTLILDNSADGDAAIDFAARSIVRFIHDNIWQSCS